MKNFVTIIIFIFSVLGVILILSLMGKANPYIFALAGIIISVVIILSFILVVRRKDD